MSQSPYVFVRMLSLQAVFTAATWPSLKEYEWVMGAHTAAYAEGMAEVIGEFTKRPDWLLAFAGVPEGEVETYLGDLLPAQMLVRLFELLHNLRLEEAAYAAADEDGRAMAARERELTAAVRLLDLPEDEPPRWEANTWYTSYPVYWHNYILASLIASQAHEAMTARFGAAASRRREVAAWLSESFYASGNAVPWPERIRRATGREIAAGAYLRRLAPRGPQPAPHSVEGC